MPPLSHLTSCTPTKSNLYLANSLVTALYRLLTFHVPKTMSLFRCLLRGTSRNTPLPEVRVGEYFTSGLFCLQRKHLALWILLNMGFSRGGVVSTSPNPPAGGPPLVCCPRLPIQFIRSYPPYRRPFLHPQPEDAPCRVDRDPLITWHY